MRVIVPKRMWLGNAGDVEEIQKIVDAGIAAVVDLAFEELAPKLPRSMVYLRFPIIDGEQMASNILRIAVETVAALYAKRIPTLVYCRAGMSRSPLVVAAALSMVDGGTPEERLQEVVAGHSCDVSPHFGQWLRRFARKYVLEK